MGKMGLVKKAEKNNWPMKIIFVFFCLILVGGVYNTGKKLILHAIVSTTPAKIAVLEERIEGEGLVFLREKIVTAPYSGQVELLHKNGQRVSQTESIAKFEAFGTTVNGKSVQMSLSSPAAGVLLYWCDGLEGIFSEDILGTSDIDKLFSATNPKKTKTTVRAGENIAKVIDNLEGIYYVIKFPVEQFQPVPHKGDNFEIQFGDFIIDAVVKDLKYDADTLYLLTQLDKLPQNFYNGRKVSCNFIKNKYTGVVLPKGAIVTKNNLMGVLTVETKKAQWKEINLIGGIGDKVVIKGITPTEVIILNPNWVKENEFIE